MGVRAECDLLDPLPLASGNDLCLHVTRCAYHSRSRLSKLLHFSQKARPLQQLLDPSDRLSTILLYKLCAWCRCPQSSRLEYDHYHRLEYHRKPLCCTEGSSLQRIHVDQESIHYSQENKGKDSTSCQEHGKAQVEEGYVLDEIIRVRRHVSNWKCKSKDE